jgi:hypothetical protein
MRDDYPYILCLVQDVRRMHDCYVAITWCESAFGRVPEPSDGAVYTWFWNRILDLLEE